MDTEMTPEMERELRRRIGGPYTPATLCTTCSGWVGHDLVRVFHPWGRPHGSTHLVLQQPHQEGTHSSVQPTNQQQKDGI